MNQTFPADRIQTVSELTTSIKGLLETQYPFVTVSGELSNLRRPFSGHFYFTLKDAEAQIRAVMFKMQQRYLSSKPEDGQQVICRGRISVYEPRGEYQLVVDTMEPKGLGSLQLAFERLKNKLAMEGLFDMVRKRPLPLLPDLVTLITSPKGAAVFDFLKVAQARCPSVPIEIFPVRVQGDGAADDITEAIRVINDMARSQVIVLCRGGGSIEDLWPFNEEKVARAIHQSHIPVVSAVGHEIDFTIADFVADLRAPTPSAAAEMVIPEKSVLRNTINQFARRLGYAIKHDLEVERHKAERLKHTLSVFSGFVTRIIMMLDGKETALIHAFEKNLASKSMQTRDALHRLEQHSPVLLLRYKKEFVTKSTGQMRTMLQVHLQRKREELRKNALLLDAVSPLGVLGRGYAIVQEQKNDRVITASSQVEVGDDVRVTLHQGGLDCRITGRR